MASTVLGGIGMFLLGMVLLTDGLKALAGESLRRLLARVTGRRTTATLAGVAVTAVVQSSSATTLMTIGFVSAGLLALEPAIAVLVGANIGTTTTAWVVALLGIKFSVGKLALPFVGVGALLKLLTRGRLAALGIAISGFGLLFIGLDTLQTGMSGVAARFGPEVFPASGGLLGRLLLVLLGVVMTVVMQSSSAALATTLTALHAGSIGLEQAAAVAIGQNVGTTVTAVMGAFGAGATAKRAALAQVLLKSGTGLLVFLALPWFLGGIVAGCRRVGVADPVLALSAFHTAFNLLGAALVLPALPAFAGLVAGLVPERGALFTRHLDPALLADAPLAVAAGRTAARAAYAEALEALVEVVDPARPIAPALPRIEEVDRALPEVRAWLGRLRTNPEAPQRERGHHVALLHALDHLERLTGALREEVQHRSVSDHADVAAIRGLLLGGVGAGQADLRTTDPAHAVEHLRAASTAIAGLRREQRPKLLVAAADGAIDPQRAAVVLEAVRWLDRLGYHTWRAAHHLLEPELTAPVAAPRTPEEVASAPAPAPSGAAAGGGEEGPAA